MNIDELKRKLINSGMCMGCVDKAIGLISNYAQSAYMEGYDRGYLAGISKKENK